MMNARPDEFHKHMDTGADAALEQNWRGAVEAYQKATQIVPDDADAQLNLGVALLNGGQLDRAFKTLKKAQALAPGDPVPLERIGETMEEMGQLKEAAQQYVQVADIYLQQRDWTKAISNWERATSLTPGLVGIHAKLAQAYERLGNKKEAIREFLTLAYNFHRLSHVDKAISAVERALRLDKNNALSLNILRALQTGGDVVLPADMLKRRKSEKDKAAEAEVSYIDLFGGELQQEIAEADPLGPIGEALNLAMELLAAHVVESGLNESIMYGLQGMELQRQGSYKEAVEAYRLADQGGLRHPSLKMCLGGLLVLSEQPQESIKPLGEAAMHPQLSAGAMHAIGLAYHKLSDQRNASRYLIKSLQAVDTSMAQSQAEIEELTSVYERLIVAIDGRNNESLTAINERFVSLLSGKDWKRRIVETRRHLDETFRNEGNQGLVDYITVKDGGNLAELISAIDRYIKQGLYTLAMDECQHAVEKSAAYLPLHVRMAEVMMKEGRIRQAINKYNMVAKAYLVREENDRAASILSTVLDMAPLDVEVRMNLIELLESEERWEEVLDQYIDLANTYQQLGDFEHCNSTFGAAERLARKINAPSNKLIEIKHYLADINQMRLNTRAAQKIYEEIMELDNQDEKALNGLVEIYYTQGNQVEAVKRLDSLLGLYARKGMVQRIRSRLEELVRSMPSDTALRARLASIYKKLNMVKEAIEQLDALGELQLDAGMNKEAASTIRQIISLKPDRVEEYKKLLSQLNA